MFQDMSNDNINDQFSSYTQAVENKLHISNSKESITHNKHSLAKMLAPKLRKFYYIISVLNNYILLILFITNRKYHHHYIAETNQNSLYFASID